MAVLPRDLDAVENQPTVGVRAFACETDLWLAGSRMDEPGGDGEGTRLELHGNRHALLEPRVTRGICLRTKRYPRSLQNRARRSIHDSGSAVDLGISADPWNFSPC